jgi:hypothetical protein
MQAGRLADPRPRVQEHQNEQAVTLGHTAAVGGVQDGVDLAARERLALVLARLDPPHLAQRRVGPHALALEEAGPGLQDVEEHLGGLLAVALADAALLKPEQGLAGVDGVERVEVGGQLARLEEFEEALFVQQIQPHRRWGAAFRLKN